MQQKMPVAGGEGRQQLQSGRMSARVLIWAVLLLAVVCFGAYGLMRGTRLGNVRLVLDPEGALAIEGRVAKTEVDRVVAEGKARSERELAPLEREETSLRTAVLKDAFQSRTAPHLEVRVFLDQQPLTEGRVWFSHAMDSDPRNLMPNMRGVVLKGTNEAKIPMPMLLQNEGEVLISAQYTRQKPGTTDEIWTFQATIPGPKEGQRWLGPDIILKREQQQVMCSGHVVNGHGQPVSGSTVELVFPGISLTAAGRSYDAMGRYLGQLSVVSAPDGFFEIRRNPKSEDGTLHLIASAPRYFPAEPITIRPGTTGLRIVLEQAGSLKGSLVLPMAADPKVLQIGLFEEGAWENKKFHAKMVARAKLAGIPSRSAFDLTPVRPGRYVCSVGYVTADCPLVVIRGIEIYAGKESRDVRLQNLDLRGSLKAIRLQVSAERRSGPLMATVSVQASGVAPGRSRRTYDVDSYGWARLTIPSAGVDLTVQAPGYKKFQRRRVTDDLSIELEKLRVLPRVEIQIEGGLPKKIPANIWLELVPSGGRGKRIQAKSFSLEGRYYFYKVLPGAYRVRLFLKRGRYARKSRSKQSNDDSPRLPFDKDRIFQVLDREQKQVFEVALDRDRLLRFIETCKKRDRPARRGR